MNVNPDPDTPERLLENVLKDDQWQTASAALKAEALGAFHARLHQRRVLRWAASVALVAVALAGTIYWPDKPASRTTRLATRNATSHPSPPVAAHYLTDDELVAAFPEGSCVLFEVDGQKELVFIDPKLEKKYYVRPGRREPY